MNESLHGLQHIDLPVCAVNQQGRVVYWNRHATDLFGIPTTAAIGHEWHTLVRTLKASTCCALCDTRRSLTNGEPVYPVQTVLSIGELYRSAVLVPITMKAEYEDALGFIIFCGVAEAATRPNPSSPIPIHSRLRQLDPDRVIVELTAREREILNCIVNGLDARGIAAHLGITHATARGYVQRVLNKLGVRNKAEAVTVALTYNLLAS